MIRQPADPQRLRHAPDETARDPTVVDITHKRSWPGH
jgi:hypothetical protein